MIRFLFFAVSCLLYHGVCGVNVVSEDSVASVEQDTVIENQIITDLFRNLFWRNWIIIIRAGIQGNGIVLIMSIRFV